MIGSFAIVRQNIINGATERLARNRRINKIIDNYILYPEKKEMKVKRKAFGFSFSSFLGQKKSFRKNGKLAQLKLVKI
jgi:hypothetical protein